MRTKVFENDYVGIHVNSVAEIMQYSALPNFAICDEYGECFDECVRGDDNIEREPTENEIQERVLQAFSEGRTLYATFYLSCGQVVPRSATTLQCDFRVGQRVYTMKDNKIVVGEVLRIDLTDSSKIGTKETLFVVEKTASKVYAIVTSGLGLSSENYICFNARKRLEDTVRDALFEQSVILNIDNMLESRKLDEIFTSKEELVNHLMNE